MLPTRNSEYVAAKCLASIAVGCVPRSLLYSIGGMMAGSVSVMCVFVFFMLITTAPVKPRCAFPCIV